MFVVNMIFEVIPIFLEIGIFDAADETDILYAVSLVKILTCDPIVLYEDKEIVDAKFDTFNIDKSWPNLIFENKEALEPNLA